MSELYTKYATEQYVDNNLNIGLEAKADAEHNHDFSYDVKGAANTALNSAKEYVDEAVSSLGTIIATDENSDGNIVLRQYNPEEDFIQVDNTLSIEGAAADAKAVGDRIKNLTTSGDAPVLDAVLGADGIMTYNNSPAFDEWLTETEGGERFAPSGYGLGTYGQTAPNNDANEIHGSGLFRAYVNTPNPDAWWNILNMDCYEGNSNASVQIANGYISTGQASICIRQKINGTWSEWGWQNPPMTLGVEYRTTERYNEQVVYTKLVNLGAFTGTSTISVGNGYKSYIRVHAIAQYGSKTYFEKVPDTMIKDYQNAGIHYIQVMAGESSITNGFVQMWYI